MTLDPARVQQLREIARKARRGVTPLDAEELLALCDSWLAQQAVVEAARIVRKAHNISDDWGPKWIHLRDALARLDTGSEV